MRLVRQAHMQSAGVWFRVDRDRRDFQIAAGANDTYRDLATICNQDFLKHYVWSFVLCAVEIRKTSQLPTTYQSTKYKAQSTKPFLDNNGIRGSARIVSHLNSGTGQVV